jgi:hypothetical protein
MTSAIAVDGAPLRGPRRWLAVWICAVLQTQAL